MLPFGGQGANQAIEDGGALGRLLQDVADAASLPARLALFEAVRRKRAARVQTLSKVRIGRERDVEAELRLYADDAATRACWPFGRAMVRSRCGAR
jgi:salicylate hydroxylase